MQQRFDFEPRSERRRRVLLGGVVSADGVQSFECAIRDITEEGARLFARGAKFPAQFHLIHVRDRTAHRARVIWNRDSEVGVCFNDSFRLAEITDPALSYLAELWFVHARIRT